MIIIYKLVRATRLGRQERGNVTTTGYTLTFLPSLKEHTHTHTHTLEGESFVAMDMQANNLYVSTHIHVHMYTCTST